MILMDFLYKQGGFDANSFSYLRKIQRSLGEKDAKSNELIIFKQPPYWYLAGYGEKGKLQTKMF